MEKIFDVMHNIRGTRYAIQLSKNVRGIPGFAPEWREREIGDVVVKFLGDEAPYMQFSDNPPNLLEEELREIIDLMERGFVESDFSQPEAEALPHSSPHTI